MGSLLELTWRGTNPLAFANGEQRRFIEDGDRITITGLPASSSASTARRSTQASAIRRSAARRLPPRR